MIASLSVQEKILYGLNITELCGVEIGPLANPLVSKEESRVEYIDRATTEEIINWYRKSDVPLDKIVAIDHVWGEESLADATGSVEKYDYCVASHVIEHVPDLIGWLMEISTILKPEGVASFSVPDRRYTFDYFRPESTPADLLDAYFRKLRKPSVKNIFDHFSSFTEIDITEAWEPGFDGSKVERKNNFEKAYKACIDSEENGAYIDSHCWVFSESSFVSLLDDLSRLGLLDFKIRRFFEVGRGMFEFVVQLEKVPPSLPGKEKHRLFEKSLSRKKPHTFRVEFESSRAGEAQVYYDVGKGFCEEDSVRLPFLAENERVELEFEIPPVSIRSLRFDPAMAPVKIKIFSTVFLLFGDQSFNVPFEMYRPGKNIRSSGVKDNYFYARSKMFTKDPFITIKMSDEIRSHS